MLKNLFKSLLRITLGVVIGIPLLLYPLLYFFQEKILFFPQPIHPEIAQWATLHYPHAAQRLDIAKGQSLQGWYVKAKPARQAPLLLYFGGNAEEVTGFLSYKDELPGIGMVTFNYRGYGGSDGQPGEQALFDDALRIYDHFGNLPEVDTRQIIVMGRSLGTGVAVYLAAQRPVHRLILTSPYDSIQSLAQAQYPYVPINWLLKHPFDSLVRAPRIKTPVLAFIGGNDRIIPASHAETLLQAWGGEMHKVLIPQADHNTLGNSQNYWQQIRDFLKVDNNGSL